MAKCETCKREMLEAKGCINRKYTYKDGTKKLTLPYGNDWADETTFEKDSRCHDCNCKYGEFHHFGCDMERCPKCRGQLITCNCEMEGEE